MHGLPLELIEQQAESLDLSLEPIFLKPNIPLEEYNLMMNQHLDKFKKQGFTHSVFGDILLADLKKYRETQLQKIGMKAVFPLWGRNTLELIQEFIEAGYKAMVVVVNNQVLDESFCGRIIDEDFIKDLPAEVDPCGENGEFHTFVFDGPLFKNPVLFKKGKLVYKKYQPSNKKKNDQSDCYKEPNNWDTQFTFLDLKPK